MITFDNTGDALQATLTIYEWGCWVGSWNTQTVTLGDDGSQSALVSGSTTVPIVGPGELGSAWRRGDPPDTSKEPSGACNGGSAAWDSAH